MILNNSNMLREPFRNPFEWIITDLDSLEPSPGRVGTLWGVQSNSLRVNKGESVELLFSPWTPLPLAGRRLAYHSWLGAWAKLHADDVLERLEGFSKNIGQPRYSQQRKTLTTFCRPYRLLCPLQSGRDVADHAPCPICELRDRLAGVVGDWREYVCRLLEPSFAYRLEVLPLAHKSPGQPWLSLDSPIRFLFLREHEAGVAFRKCADTDFAGKTWIVKKDEYDLELTPTERVSNCHPMWGRTLSLLIPQEDDLTDFASMAMASEGKRPEDLSHERAEQVRDWLGPDAVLVPLVWGLKHPTVSRYYARARQWMQQWEEYSKVIESSTIAFVCGPDSGNLCSLDLDLLSELSAVVRFNPWMRNVMTIYGKRGCAILFRLRGAYNAKPYNLSITHEDGKRDHVGELRLGSCLQTVDGLHPSGIFYRVENAGIIPTVNIGEFTPPLHWDDLKPKEEKPHYRPRDQSACLLDFSKLKFMQNKGGWYDCQCPACAEMGKDTNHDNLRIWKRTWGFKCIAGCDREEILECVGKVGWDEDQDNNYESINDGDE